MTADELSKQLAAVKAERDDWKRMYYAMTNKRNALEAKLENIEKWFETQAEKLERRACDTRFASIADGYKADAKTFRAIAKDIHDAVYAYLKEKGIDE